MSGAVWYAILVYVLGMAVVLYLRPAIMFKPSGVWKEFGVSATEGYTVFPFWMFSIVWAIMSYALVTVSTVFITKVVQRSEVNLNAAPVATPISQATIAPANMGSAKRLPGYYILENLPEGPRYVYWGTEAPTMQNVVVRQQI
jgi:hypothetical protein